MLIGQQQYKMYGGDKCSFDYLIYSPSGKVADANPKIIQLCDYKQDLYQQFEADSLRKLPEFKNYDFYYIPNTHSVVSEKLECLDLVHYKVTRRTNASSEENVFLFIKDSSITSVDLSSSNLKEKYTNIILISDLAQTATSQNEQINIDQKRIISAFKSADGEAQSFARYNGDAQSFNFTLSGTLKDAETGESLPFATILAKGTSSGVTTNIDGYFTLHDVPTDTSSLIVSYIGYKTTEVKLNPHLSKSNLLIEVVPSSLKKGLR